MLSVDEKAIVKQIRKGQLEELKSYIEHLNCQEEVVDCIKILKRNAAFIDERGSHAYDLIVDNIETGNELTQQYFCEIKILNSIFCEERKLQSKLQEIPAKYRLAYLILVINQNSLDNYDAIIKKGHEANGISDGFVSLDMTNELHADTLKSLFYDNEISNKQSFLYAPFLLHYNKKYFQIARDYLINAANVCQWKVLYNAWKNGMIEVNSVGGENIFRYKNEKTGWLLKSYGKYVVYKSLNEIQHAIVMYYYPKAFTKSKLPYDETLSVGLLNNYLHCQSEQIDVKEIPLAYWIKAYEFVVRYSKKCRLVVNEKSNTILAWLIKKINVIKPRSAWIKLMTRSGIPYKYASKLFDYMLLTSKSDDIFDFPFIEAKGGYMISYAVLCGGLSGLIVGSRINQPDIAFSDRGKFFENYVRSIFKEPGIPHVQLHLKTGSNEYECDLAFVLNDVLFMCELKDTGSRQIREGEINFYENDVEQIDRIGSFFQMHENYVQNEFLKAGYKVKYKTVIKLLIYNTHFHGVIHSNNTRVMGIDTFIAPIRRSPLDIRVCGLYGGPIECLQGDFTAKKFLQYMKHPFNECYYENMWYIHEYNFNVGNMPIKGEFLTAKPFDRREINEIIDPMPDLF